MYLIEKIHLLNRVNSTLEVANFFNKSIKTIWRYRKAGFLTADGPKNKLFFSKETIENFIIMRGL